MDLKLQNVIGSQCFSGIGQPTGIYRHPNRSLFAVAGTLESAQWGARSLDLRRRGNQRVAIFAAGTCRRVGVLEIGPWPINDVAFHPHLPVVAIATGRYDGGFFYEGELLVWNYGNGPRYSRLQQYREVTRCRFDADGDTLTWLTRPPTDEGEDDNDLDKVFFAFQTRAYWGSAPAEAIDSIATNEAGFDQPYVRQSPSEVVAALQHLAAESGQRYEPRWHVWDLAWRNDRELLAASGNPALETWDVAGAQLARFDSAEGVGVQLVRQPQSEIFLLNRYHGGIAPWNWSARRSALLRYDPTAGEPAPLVLDHAAFCLSVAASGHMLARDCSGWRESTADHLWEPDLTPIACLNLGRCDPINHYLRIDDGDALYFLQGTPQESHQNKWVCRLDPLTQQVERLFPLEWDLKRNAHVLSDGGCWISDAGGPALVLAAVLHNYDPYAGADTVVCRRRLLDGAVAWMHRFESQVTAMLPMPARGVIALALTEGKIGLIDAQTGALCGMQELRAEGVDSFAMSLAVHGTRLAAGTVDGRILLFDVRA